MKFLVVAAFTFSSLLQAALDPAEVNVKILALYLSKDPYCSSPFEVFTTSEPGFVDMIGGPTLGQLDNSKFQYDGAYRCVIVKMSESIQFVPTVGSGGCSAGNKFETQICADGIITTAIDGSTSPCTGGPGDPVYLYLSTASTSTSLSTSTNPFSPPTTSVATNGLTLANTLTIAG